FGTLLLLGDSPEPSRQTLTHDVLTRQLRIVGTHNAKLSGDAAWWTEERQIGFFLELIARGEMRVADLVTHRFGPEDPQEVYQLLQRQRETAMGVLFDWRGLNPGR
ncbi:MAG: hypothetical protein HUU35_20345, partial [Armatimonadetes bacterium]|nr:hypothetical protein [Armatimonadota bacterium]